MFDKIENKIGGVVKMCVDLNLIWHNQEAV
jgi:hypothetical protein